MKRLLATAAVLVCSACSVLGMGPPPANVVVQQLPGESLYDFETRAAAEFHAKCAQGADAVYLVYAFIDGSVDQIQQAC